MEERKKRLRLAIAVGIVVSLTVCPFATGRGQGLVFSAEPGAILQIEFTPDLATLELRTEVPSIIATAVAAGGLESLEGGQLPTYRRVPCGAIDDTICFELCYAGLCNIYGDDEERVQRFMEQVDDIKEQFDKLELARIEAGANVWDTIGTCLKSVGAGFGAAGVIAGIVVAVDPTGILKAIAIGAAALGAFGGLAGCGSAIAGAGSDGEIRDDLVRDFGNAANDAIFEFEDLRRNPPES